MCPINRLQGIRKFPCDPLGALDITEGAVKGHVNNIMIRLGVHDRTEAAATALRRGIVHIE